MKSQCDNAQRDNVPKVDLLGDAQRSLEVFGDF